MCTRHINAFRIHEALRIVICFLRRREGVEAARMRRGSEEGSCLRLIDFCITPL